MTQKQRSCLPQPWAKIIIFGLLLLASFVTERYNHLLFHTIIEMLSLIATWSICIFAVYTHQYSQNSFFMFLGIAYAFIGALQLVHVLTYPGMNVFSLGQPNDLTGQLWLVARFFESITLLASINFLTQRTLRIRLTVGIYTIIFVISLLSIFFWNIFPVTYVSGLGITSTKIISEYVIMAIMTVAMVLTIRMRDHFPDKEIYSNFIAVYGFAIAAEFLFVTSLHPSNTILILGHFLKFISIYHIYFALVMGNLHRPYRQLELVNQRLYQQMAEREEEAAKKSRYERELNQLSKLRSISTLAGGIAHDFKNVLTIIHGNASLAELYTKDQRVHNKLIHIKEAAMQGSELSSQLLSFTRDEKPKKDPINIQKLVQRTTEMTLSGSRVKADFVCPPNPIIVAADGSQLQQVINNIVINAIQAMPRGGRITIRLSRNTIDPNNDSLPLPRGEYISISFSDQGVGISGDNLSQIFDPFFSTKEQGSGLGLATSFTIIKNHDGYIAVDSQVGVGTTFTIYLPYCREIQKTAEQAAPTQDQETEA